MKLVLFCFTLLCSSLFALDTSLQDIGVEVEANGKTLILKREIKPECYDVKFDANSTWSGDFAASNVPKECKKTFVTTFGSVSPVKMSGIETYGELETLDFIQKMNFEPNKYILVDSRTASWYKSGTIAGAVNLPFLHVMQSKKYPKEFEEDLKTLGVKLNNGKYDFSNAKIALFFCNGIWCAQSTYAIKALVDLGYPKEKMFWYRGGMQDWASVGLSVYKP